MSLKKGIQQLLEKYAGQKIQLFELKHGLIELNPYDVSTPAYQRYDEIIKHCIMEHQMGNSIVFTPVMEGNLVSMIDEPVQIPNKILEAANWADKDKGGADTGISAKGDVGEGTDDMYITADMGEKKEELVKSEFAVDDSSYYPGYHNPAEHWNGWAIPMFDKETAIKICKDLDKPYEEKDGKLLINLDPDSEDSELEEAGPFKEKVDGKEIELYDIGGSIWVWAEKDDEE